LKVRQVAAANSTRRRPIVARCLVESAALGLPNTPPILSVDVGRIDRGPEPASRAGADDRIVLRLSNVFVIDGTPPCQSWGMINVTLAAVCGRGVWCTRWVADWQAMRCFMPVY